MSNPTPTRSEYTPTTEQVKVSYRYANDNAVHSLTDSVNAEFDRWLAAHDQSVRDLAIEDAAKAVEGAPVVQLGTFNMATMQAVKERASMVVAVRALKGTPND